MKKLSTLLFVILTGLMLSACGGGSTGSSGDGRIGTTQLSWAAPSSRADGSYMSPSELQGYRIYYGTTPDNLSMLVDLNDETITDYTISELPSGIYYFAVTAYDAEGTESAFSNVISKNI